MVDGCSPRDNKHVAADALVRCRASIQLYAERSSPGKLKIRWAGEYVGRHTNHREAKLRRCYNQKGKLAVSARASAVPPAPAHSRGVAQPGRAPGSGPGGRRFKSSLPDHSFSISYSDDQPSTWSRPRCARRQTRTNKCHRSCSTRCSTAYRIICN